MPKPKPSTRDGRVSKAIETLEKRDRTISSRLATARAALDSNSSLSAWARSEGFSPAYGHKFLKRYDPDLLSRFREQYQGLLPDASKKPCQIVWILKMLYGVDEEKWSQRYIAKLCGVTPTTVTAWRRKYAPHGVVDALDDYMEDEYELEEFEYHLANTPVMSKTKPGREKLVEKSVVEATKKTIKIDVNADRPRNESRSDVWFETNPELTF